MTNNEEALAESLGYSLTTDDRWGIRFNQGARHIWPTREGWQTADLIDGYYKNHRKFTSLSEALNRKLIK